MPRRFRIRRGTPPIPADRQWDFYIDMFRRHGLISGPDDVRPAPPREPPSPERKVYLPMGMFDKDKEYGLRLDEEFPLTGTPGRSEEFIIWDASVLPGKVETEIGEAEVAAIDGSHLESPDQHFACQTLASAIVEKARLAEPDDFPAVVRLQVIEEGSRFGTDVMVLRFIRPYKDGE